MDKKRIFLVSLLLILVAGALASAVFFISRKKSSENESVGSEETSVEFKDDNFKFKLKYPSDFSLGKISLEDQKKDPLMFKAVRLDPPMLVLVWKEGLGVVEAFTKKPSLDYLYDNVDRKYSIDYPEFKKEKQKKTKIDGENAFLVEYTFQDPKKDFRERIRQVIWTKGSEGWHLSCMAPVSMWWAVQEECKKIAESFEFL